MHHYLIAKDGRLVAVAHATSGQQARSLATAGGFAASCEIHHNDPAKGYVASGSRLAKLEKF